ncbi:MAG: endonuclease NucS [Desulfurococcales archaeon]|nr:endonuclease NucS [Desulfurococcales archaeon]MCE4605176.1 endonuclease NucS [Desulfurococcales archaeon]
MPLGEILQEPGLEEARQALYRAIESHAWIAMYANCMVEYEGRSASRAIPGDRLIIVKPDGTVIIHGPRGFRPGNWQPDTSSITVTIEEDLLVLKAVRRRPREVLAARCGRVYMLATLVNPEEGGFWMYLNEHEIRDLIAEDPGIVEEGLRIVEAEKKVAPGFIDLYAVDRDGNLVVIEVKRVKAGEEAARQLARYVGHLRRQGRRVRGILVAPDATEAAIYRLEREGLEYRRIDLQALYERLKAKSRRSGGILRFLSG